MLERDDPAAIYIGSDGSRVDLVVAHASVSPIHCKIFRDPTSSGGYLIAQLSQEGVTSVGDQRLFFGQVAPFGQAPLTLGEVTVQPARPMVRKLEAPEAFTAPLEVPFTLPNGSRGQRASMPRPQPRVGTDVRAVAGSGSRPRRPVENVVTEHAVALTLGSHAKADVRVTHPSVSREHARIYLVNGEYVLEDLGSTNGTSHKGQPVQRVKIRPGEHFLLGELPMVFDEQWARRLQSQIQQFAAGARNVRIPAGLPREITVGRHAGNLIVLNLPGVAPHHVTLEVLPEQNAFRVRNTDPKGRTALGTRGNTISIALAGPNETLILGTARLHLSAIATLLQKSEDHREEPGHIEEIPIPPDLDSVIIGRDEELVDLRIALPTVSRQHAEIRPHGDAFAIADLGSTGGTHVNGVLIDRPTQFGWADVISLGEFSFRLVPMSHSKADERSFEGDIVLDAASIGVTIKPRFKPPIEILRGISFAVFPSEFVGLLGPSGSGKTTLLESMNGSRQPSAGQVRINGHDIYHYADAFRGNIGYVPQDDVIFRQLTVYECLYYTARLRMPEVSKQDIDERIAQILERLDIAHRRDTIVGDAVKKGISGGQRKRVNLAQELITDPALLLLDEPTSGLSAADTMNVMRLLRGLADEGKTIMLTIHQPSLDAYQQMDNVIYLCDGQLVFYGPAYPDSIDYFNPRVRGAELEQLRLDPGNALLPIDHAIREAGGPRSPEAEAVVSALEADYAASDYHRDYVEDRATSRESVTLRGGDLNKAPRRGVFRQLRTLVSRQIRVMSRDVIYTLVLLLQAPVIGLLLAAVFAGSDSFFDDIVRQPKAMFMMVASAVWFGCTNAAREIVGEQAIYRRERMVNLIIPSYLGAKTLVLGTISLVQCAMMLGILYFALGFTGGFFGMLWALWLVAMFGVGMGLVVSAHVRTVQAAISIVPLLLIPQIVLGGTIQPIHELGVISRAFASMTATRWGYESLLHTAFDRERRERAGDDIAVIRGECATEADQDSWTCAFIDDQTYAPVSERCIEIDGSVRQDASCAPVQIATTNALCQSVCNLVRAEEPLTPIDRAVGIDDLDPARAAYITQAEARGVRGDAPRTARTNRSTANTRLALWIFGLFAYVALALRLKDRKS